MAIPVSSMRDSPMKKRLVTGTAAPKDPDEEERMRKEVISRRLAKMRSGPFSKRNKKRKVQPRTEESDSDYA